MIYDVIIIGAGILGSFCARQLSAYDLKIAVLESREDVSTGLTAANSAIIYCGHDTKPDTLKSECCVNANKTFDTLCSELGVDFKRCGSILCAYGEKGLEIIREKYDNGLYMGVEGLEILTGDEVRSLEGALSPGIKYGLLALNTGTVMPWELCFAAAANAVKNGAEFIFNEDVKNIAFSDGVYTVETAGREYRSRSLINCGGLRSVAINEMLGITGVSIVPKMGDYLVLDKNVSDIVSRVIFEEREDGDKGVTLIPTVDGSLLVGPTRSKGGGKKPFTGGYDDKSYSSFKELEILKEKTKHLVPDISLEIIRSFSTVRHSTYRSYTDERGKLIVTDEKVQTFGIYENDAFPGYFGLVGIRTPGLTCSHELAMRVAGMTAEFLNAEMKDSFDPVQEPVRKYKHTATAAGGDENDIVCHCEKVTKADIIRAMRSEPGAVTLDGVKKRIGAMLGRCQGSRCSERIMEIMAEELGISAREIEKDGTGSWIIQREYR